MPYVKGHIITEKEIIIIVLEGIVERERRIGRKNLKFILRKMPRTRAVGRQHW